MFQHAFALDLSEMWAVCGGARLRESVRRSLGRFSVSTFIASPLLGPAREQECLSNAIACSNGVPKRLPKRSMSGLLSRWRRDSKVRS